LKALRILSWLVIFCLCSPLWADTIILKDGTSYSGQYTGSATGLIAFTGIKGVKYRFPRADVQSLVFTAAGDTVTLRNGKVYSGHFAGGTVIGFTDAAGIGYQFPISDASSLVFTSPPTQPPATASVPIQAEVIPAGTEITISTNEAIDSTTAAVGQTYSAEISQDLRDSTGAVAIPQGTSGQLLIRHISGGGIIHSPDLVLDLDSVTVNGKQYSVVSSDVKKNNKKGIGANKRTAEMVGGGAAIGSLVGALFGGGKGAAIGAAAGVGGGGLTQIFTRGKQVEVPAETQMTFRLESTLILQPTS
jgi:hypothetical protein